MKQLLFVLFCLLTIGGLHARNTSTDELYGLGNWDADSLGNHRVVVFVEKPADAVLATIEWRRRDLNPEDKNLIVVDATTGKRITNVCRFAVNRERGEVAFVMYCNRASKVKHYQFLKLINMIFMVSKLIMLLR